MTKYKSLRKSHPQKYFLKLMCDFLYYFGTGVCWYEERVVSLMKQRLYNAWCVVSNVYLFGGVFNEYLAHLRSDLTVPEKNDLMQFTLAHSSILSKIIVLYVQKKRIKLFLERFLERNREYSSLDLEEASLRKAIKFCSAIIISVSLSVASAQINAIATYIRQGTSDRQTRSIFQSTLVWALESIIKTMIKYKSLRNSHPQKYFLKLMCDFLYYFGTGVCWYEERVLSLQKQRLYNAWCVVSNVYLFGGVFNEYLAHFRSDLTVLEKNDLMQFTLGHSSILSKIIVLYVQKKRIKLFLERFLERNREYSSLDLEEASLRKAIKFCSAIIISVMLTMISAQANAIAMYIRQGIPIITEITLYPGPSTHSIVFNFLRFLVELHWWYLCTVMTLIDCLCCASLVFLGFKFQHLQQYFEGLREKFLLNPNMKSKQALEEEFEKDFVAGIKLHEDALWCARNVQYALGNLYSIQVVESIVLIVMCLLKLVASERTLTFLMANFMYFSCVVLLTGAYMMAGGDITYEASMVPTSMFHCGWELGRGGRRLRTLAVVALMNGQLPVLMTAFGVITLSYTNFLMVLRHSYSFFAVMY